MKDWKKQNVAPAFKKESKDESGNYRLISLILVHGKTLESVMTDSIVNHLVTAV